MAKPAIVDGSESARGALRAFISYSRRDIEFARRLMGALEARGITVTIDTRDLPTLEDWRRELLGFIQQADAVIFLVSRSSVSSPICSWEIDQVEALGKRLAPLILEHVPDDAIPAPAGRINYLLFDGTADFEQQANKLSQALQTDIGWVKEHTHLGQLARRWDERQRSTAALLRGRDLLDAERWISSRPRTAPEPTILQRDLIQASRRSTTRRLRHVLAGSIVGMLFAVVLAGAAFWQRNTAQQNAAQAEIERNNARSESRRADQEKDRAIANEREAVRNAETARSNEARAAKQTELTLATQSRMLANHARQEIDRGNEIVGALLALEGLPTAGREPVARPIVPAAVTALQSALHARRRAQYFWGHTSDVLATAISRDGKYLASVGDDETARIWDIGSGRELRVLNGHNERVYGVEFNATGSQLLTVSWQHARLWDVPTGKLVGRFDQERFDDAPQAVRAALSPDGKRLAKASSDQYLEIWDIAEEQLLVRKKKHQHATWSIKSLSYNFDGTKILTASWDKTARIWSAEDLMESHLLSGHSEPIEEACFSPDGRYVVTVSHDRTARVWSSSSGDLLHVLAGHSDALNGVAVSPNSQLIATTSRDKTARIWDARNGQLVFVLGGHGNSVEQVNFSPDGRRLLTYSTDHTSRLWSIENGEQIAVFGGTLSSAHGGFTPDGSRIVTRSDGALITLWSTDLANVSIVDRIAEASVSTATFDAEGKRFALGADNGIVGIYDFPSGRLLASLAGHTRTVSRVQFNKKGNRLVSISWDRTARLWNLDNGSVLAVIESPPASAGVGALIGNRHDYVVPIRGERDKWMITRLKDYYLLDGVVTAAFSDDDALLKAVFWDLSQKVFRSDNGEAAANDMAFTAQNSSFLATESYSMDRDGGDYKNARLVFLSDRKSAIPLEGENLGQLVRILLGKDGKSIYALSADGLLHAWHAETGSSIYQKRVQRRPAMHVDLSPDGRLIATSGGDGTVRVWSAGTGQEMLVYTGHRGGSTTRASFSPNGLLVVSAGSRSDLGYQVWETHSGRPIATLGNSEIAGTWAIFSPDGHSVIGQSLRLDRSARIWRMLGTSTEAIVENGTKSMPRCLTRKERQYFSLGIEPPQWCIEQRLWPYRRARLGVELKAVDRKDASDAGLPQSLATRVQNVLFDTGAEDAGLERGDVILTVNGKEAVDPDVVISEVAASRPFSKIQLRIWRAGSVIDIDATLGGEL